MAVGRLGAGSFALELGGAAAGFLVSAAGGEAFGQVVEERPGNIWVPKHIGGVSFADIVIESSVPMSSPLGSWIASLFEGQRAVMSGAIVFLDQTAKVHDRLEWTNGAISEVTFPAADAASKDAARVRVTITPETTRLVAGSGASYKRTTAQQKVVPQSNFRYTVSGLEQADARVSKVTSISVTRRATDDIGELRDFEKVGVVLDVSNFAVTLPQIEAAPYAAWFDDFVIQGNCDASHERTGSLTFLDTSLKNELLRIDLGGVGIARITYERGQGGARVEAMPKATVDLYCESVQLAT